MSYINL
jgi:hypothetical protein